jgi:hypothetical protein
METDYSAPSKFLVRRISRNKFLSPAGRWVKRAEAAFNFPNQLNAINTCLARGLKNVELILRFEGNIPDRRIPLDGIQ